MAKEKKRRYYDDKGNLLLETENAADAVNVDFDNTGSGMEADNVQDAINELHGLIPSVGSVATKNPRQEEVFLGYMEQSGNWVKQTCIVKPVNRGITYHFVLPDDVIAKVEYGTDNTLGSASGNISNGQSFTIGTNTNAQRISFAKTANGAVSMLALSDANEMIAGGSIRVYVDDDDIITHNYAKDPMLRALSKKSYSGSAARMPLIAHISDIHGDAQRAKRCLEFCKHYGIDTVVFSGDQAMVKYSDGSSYVFAAAEKVGQHVCFVIGNHEVQYTNSVVNIPSASQGASTNYDNHLDGHIDELGYIGEGGEQTETGYYYHDISGKNIRIIVLDQHDGGEYSHYGGGTSNNYSSDDAAGSAVERGGRISQAQINWFIDTLKSTPSGYGIIIALHSPEAAITQSADMNKFHTTCPDGTYSYAPNGLYVDSSRPIRTIVDAFISRGTCSGSWTMKYKGADETVSFASTGDHAADFSSVPVDVEFVCYLNGHIHQDRAGLLAGATNRQLNFNIIAGAGLPAAPDDIPIDGVGVTQDAFNVYAIDRTNKQVRIMRIGSNVKKDLTMRDYMVISYAPSNS